MSGLYLNYCFCKLTPDTEKVYITQYNNETDNLRSIRDEYPEYSFYRDGNQLIYWANKFEENKEITQFPSECYEISSLLTPRILSKMIENKIYNLFKDTNKYDLYYERYSHNLVAKKRTPIFSDEGLNIYVCAEISTYFFEQGENIYYGFMVSNNLSYSFNWSKKDFSDNNIDSDGLFENKKGYVAANTRAISRYEEARGLSQQLCTLRESFEKKNKQFEFTNKAIDWLKKGLLGELYGNISIDSCEINYFPYDKVFENEILVPPKKYFANDKVGVGLPSAALEQIGPYKANAENETVNITIVALKENEGSLNYFTKQLSTKINKLFRINVQYSFSWVDKDSVQSFSEAILPINSKNADLVIFVVKQEQKFMNPKFSPYFYCKAKLIGQEVPTQCICIETIKRSNDFILSNISLNIYAKLGGTAWGIEKKDTTKKELIVGIGATVNYKKQQVMSIANVFDNSGVYLAGACNPIIDYENYAHELEKLLIELFDSVLYGEKDVHLIFHLFKSASKNKEIKALENVIKHFKDINITYAFVHLGYGHNFRIYYNDGNNDLKKGQYIHISQDESLLIMNDKSNVPLKITVDKRSNFKDIYYISQQIFAFAHLSERSFKPSKKPITILYPSIMAGLIEKLKMIDNWDYDKLKVKGVTEKLWFL